MTQQTPKDAKRPAGASAAPAAGEPAAAVADVPRVSFRTTILRAGKTATGIEVPLELVASLGTTKRPPVLVTINGHTYRSTVAVMGGALMVSVSAENRESHKQAHVLAVEGAKTAETRQRRIAKAVSMLRE